MDIPTNKPDYWVEGIQEAALSVASHWCEFEGARDPVHAATAVVALSNAVFDLMTYLPGFDMEQGRIDWSVLD